MSRRAIPYTQAEIARVLRAAKQVGAASVEVKIGDAVVNVKFIEKGKPEVDEGPPIEL